VTAYTYDPAGNLLTRTDANSDVTSYAYDAADRLTSTTDPLENTVKYTYDAEGDNIVVTDARGQTTTTTFDARELPTTVAYSDGTPTVTYTYDKTGQLTGIQDATGTRTLTRDADSRLTAVTSGSTGFAYTYDADGDVTARTYPDGEKATYTYDKDDQQTAQTTDGATTAYAYDAAGELTTTTPPSTAGTAETRGYDAAGRLTSVKSYEGTYSLNLDADGQPTSVELSVPDRKINGLQAYSYDDDGRLLTACNTSTESATCTSKETYTYDKVGNRLTATSATGLVGGSGPTTTTYTYNAADELTQSTTGSTSTAYGYDADGNQTTAGSNTYTYNAADQLSGADVAGTAYTFTNNAEGNRVTTTSGGTVKQTETWDINGSQPQLATLHGAGGALEGDFHYDPLGTIQSEHTSAGAFYDYTDDLGSVTDLVSSAGVDQDTYTYDAFGSQSATQLVSTAPVQPFGFTGALDDQTIPGQLDLNVRSYVPGTGTFTTRDPNAAKNTDPYVAAYVYGNDAPTYMTDPSGRSPGSWIASQWDQFSSGFAEGTEAPFQLVSNLYDAFTGQNGGWSGFFDTYIPARPAYRLYTIADMLQDEGCDQLADLYENAGNELASQIAALGIGGLTGWEQDAAAADASELGANASGDADAFRGPKGTPRWYPTGPIISLARLKQMLGRAGFGDLVNQYDLEYTPVILDGDNPAYGVTPATGAGPMLGANGKPIIRFSNIGLQNIQEAVTTFFHEVYHQQTWATKNVPGGEPTANAYGESMWDKYRNRFQ